MIKEILWNLGIVLRDDCIKAVQDMKQFSCETIQQYAKDDFGALPAPNSISGNREWVKNNFKIFYMKTGKVKFTHAEQPPI